jgi:alpha-aminoadipate/glutamate carrier protein LysW
MATCPVCDSEDLEVDEFEVDEGDVVNCPDCGASLTIMSLTPLEFEAADDDDDDDDDDLEDEDDVDDEDDDDDDEDEKEDWDE